MSMSNSTARKRLSEATPTTPELHAALRALAGRVEAEGDIAARPGQMASLYAIAEDITELTALLDAHPVTEREAWCGFCDHPTHADSHCGFVVGYDHMNGDHECGCNSDEFDWLTWCQDVTGVYYTELEDGRAGVENLVRESMEFVRELTSPTPREAVEREALAKAWDEGHTTGALDVTNLRLWNYPPTPNPYRTPAPQEGGNENGSGA